MWKGLNFTPILQFKVRVWAFLGARAASRVCCFSLELLTRSGLALSEPAPTPREPGSMLQTVFFISLCCVLFLQFLVSSFHVHPFLTPRELLLFSFPKLLSRCLFLRSQRGSTAAVLFSSIFSFLYSLHSVACVVIVLVAVINNINNHLKALFVLSFIINNTKSSVTTVEDLTGSPSKFI